MRQCLPSTAVPAGSGCAESCTRRSPEQPPEMSDNEPNIPAETDADAPTEADDRRRARHPRSQGAAHADPGRRPGRPDRRLPAGQAGPARDPVRGRGPGRRHRQDRGPRRPRRRVPLRPRRPPLLHQGPGGRRPLARDHARGVPQAPAHVAHLLEQEVPGLPAARPGRDQEARPDRADALHGLLPDRQGEAQGRGEDLRAVGHQPLRQAPVRQLLPLLHREGVGHAGVGDPRRLGRPADQGPVVLQRRQGRVLRQQGRRDQVADLRVQLPALRPRPDVGDHDRRHQAPRRRDPHEHAGREAPRRERQGHQGDRRRQGVRVQPGHLARCRCATWPA